MRLIILLQFVLIVLGLFSTSSQAAIFEVQEISVFEVSSAITPATYDYLKSQLTNLPGQSLILVKINTPGGLVTTTKEIITLLSDQKKPLAIWITPEGASASSAGAIIASSAHFIFMSPGTNMGAATPVGLGEDIKEKDGRSKMVNDLSALVRSLSSSRGKPSTPFEQMISSAKSYTDQEALKDKIIDGIFSKQDEVKNFFQNKTVTINGQSQTLHILPSTVFKDYQPTVGQRILNVLTNPSTAYFLFLIGVALIYFELQAPGGYILGGVGSACLLLAAISFQVLPLHWGSFGLILVGVFMLILEIYVISYGLLALGGLVAFTAGSLFLFDGEAGFISIEYSVIFSTLAGIILPAGFIVWYLWKENKKQKPIENFFIPIGAKATVMTKLADNTYQIKVRGEIWKAESKDLLNIGDTVEVINIIQEHLIAHVKKHS